MAERIVDLFELSKSTNTTENGRPEREARLHSDSALHRKIVSFDAGQAIGDRLLLQLLEYERVVQRGRKKIGQRVQNQNILRRERILLAALDVEHTSNFSP